MPWHDCLSVHLCVSPPSFVCSGRFWLFWGWARAQNSLPSITTQESSKTHILQFPPWPRQWVFQCHIRQSVKEEFILHILSNTGPYCPQFKFQIVHCDIFKMFTAYVVQFYTAFFQQSMNIPLVSSEWRQPRVNWGLRSWQILKRPSPFRGPR